MGEISFNLTPVADKPSRRYRKGSKYDPILDAFTARANENEKRHAPGLVDKTVEATGGRVRRFVADSRAPSVDAVAGRVKLVQSRVITTMATRLQIPANNQKSAGTTKIPVAFPMKLKAK